MFVGLLKWPKNSLESEQPAGRAAGHFALRPDLGFGRLVLLA